MRITWFILFVLAISDLSYYGSTHGWGDDGSNPSAEAARQTAFQQEFGTPYPSTAEQRQNATAIVMVRVANLYQKAVTSWDQYSTLQARLDQEKETPPASVDEAKAQLTLSQDVDHAGALQRTDFEKLGDACNVLYSLTGNGEGGYKRQDNYPELSIPPQPGCRAYFNPNPND